MRLWSLHPKYLDAAGLTACWREGLLARKVLYGGTKGYTRHPQLERFRQGAPAALIDAYLHAICDEADSRGYHYDRSKLGPADTLPVGKPSVTRGQVEYEFSHLLRKLESRAPHKYAELKKIENTETVEPHPIFKVIPGEVESWERTQAPDSKSGTSRAGKGKIENTEK